MNGSMNTKIHYLYRDADNYKVHNSCVIKGVLTPEQINVILSCCDAGEYFIPNQVGLPERKFEKIDPQVDHCWFELTRDDFEYTDQPAILMHTPMGQIILAVCAAVLFISTAAVIKLTQPIEYKR